jgi:putative ABC transport system ATP-binding protein
MIEVHDITKTYQTGDMALQVLKGISFTIRDGELCAIMGPSGSGKSTLMNIIGCLDTLTSGSYFLDGEDVASFSETELARVRNRKVGFVFQSFNLLARTTALDNVALPLLYAGVEPHERHERAVAALNAVGLGDRLDHKPNQLSGGQQQRVAIARAIVTTPSLILADEPTGNLDSRSSVEVMSIFQQLNAQLGVTVIFVTHEPDIMAYTRRVLRIRDGYLGADEPILNSRSAADELAARTDVIPLTPRIPVPA